MASLTRSAINAAADLETRKVDVPEWGGYVFISMLDGINRDAWENSIITVGENGSAKQNLDNIRAKLLTRAIVDEDGNRLFTDPGELGRKSGAVLGRLFEIAKELNAVTDADVDELAKN